MREDSPSVPASTSPDEFRVNPSTSPSGLNAPRERQDDCRVIAVANQKGGVGKSTTSVNLGAALAESGARVLVVDLDPQGNASTGMGIDHSQREVSSYQVLTSGVPAEDAIVDTAVPNLSAIPATIDLAGAEIELVSQFSREGRLTKALEPIRPAYDFIILDCPPSLGLLTVNALTASTELIVPIQCEYYALEGLGQLLRNVRLVQQNVNPSLRLSGIVLTMFDSRTKLAEQVVAEVRRYFGSRVYDTVIPRTVRLSEAPGYGQPITTYDSASKGAECYRSLAREVLERPTDEGAHIPVGDEDLPAVILPARTEDEDDVGSAGDTANVGEETGSSGTELARGSPGPAPSESDPVAKPIPGPEPDPEPEPTPDSEPTPDLELEPTPEPDAEPVPEPETPAGPEPTADVPPGPTPDLAPEPAASPASEHESSDEPLGTVEDANPTEGDGIRPEGVAMTPEEEAQERRRHRFLRWREGGKE